MIIGVGEIGEHVGSFLPNLAHELVAQRLTHHALLVLVQGAMTNDLANDHFVALVQHDQGPAQGKLIGGEANQAFAVGRRGQFQLDQFEIALGREFVAVPFGGNQSGVGFQHPAAAIVLPDGDQVRTVTNEVVAVPVQPLGQIERRQSFFRS